MSSYESRAEVAAKIDWEGGVMEAVDYGLCEDDMPEGDDELRSAWRDLKAAYSYAESAAARVAALLPEGSGW